MPFPNHRDFCMKMMKRCYDKSLLLLCWLTLILLLWSPAANAQEKIPTDNAYQTAAEQVQPEVELKQVIEPGMFVIGKSHRFAEVGDCDSFSLSPDGKTLACSGSPIKLFDLGENKIRETVGEEGESYRGVEFSDDGRFLVAHTYVNGNSVIRVWNAIDLGLVTSFFANEGVASDAASRSFYIQQFQVSPENNYIAASDYQTLVVRDLKTGELVHEVNDLGWAVQSIRFSPNDDQLIFPKSGGVQVIDLETGDSLSNSESKVAGALATVLDINTSQKIVATANGGSIRITEMDGNNRNRVLTLPAATYAQSLKFSDDGKWIAASVWQSVDGVYQIGIAILDVDSGKLIKHIKKTGVAGQTLGQMQFATNNRFLFYIGPGLHGINEINLISKESDSDSKFPRSPAIATAIHPDHQSFAACTSAGEVNRFDFNSGEILATFSFPNPRNLVLSRDGTELLITSNYGQQGVRLFDYQSGKLKKKYDLKSSTSVISKLKNFMTSGSLNSIQAHSYPISVARSADGKKTNAVVMELIYSPIGGAITGEFDQRNSIQFIQLDSESGRRVGRRRFLPQQFGLTEYEWAHLGAVSHDGSRFAVGTSDKLVVVDTISAETLYEVTGQAHGQIVSTEFSPDDRFLITVMPTIVVVRRGKDWRDSGRAGPGKTTRNSYDRILERWKKILGWRYGQGRPCSGLPHRILGSGF